MIQWQLEVKLHEMKIKCIDRYGLRGLLYCRPHEWQINNKVIAQGKETYSRRYRV